MAIEDLKWVYNSHNEIVIKGCSKGVSILKIPSEIDGIKVVGIDDGAFYNNHDLQIVEISSGVKYIGLKAFSLSLVEQVHLPNTLKEIGEKAFYCCELLSKINLPGRLNVIDNYAFAHSGIKEIIIPDSVSFVGNSAFADCNNVLKLKISNNLRVIKSSTFDDCCSLTKIIIPKNVEEIEGGAFRGCISLQEIVFLGTEIRVDGGVLDYLDKNKSIKLVDLSNIIRIKGKVKDFVYNIPDLSIIKTGDNVQTNLAEAILECAIDRNEADVIEEKYISLVNKETLQKYIKMAQKKESAGAALKLIVYFNKKFGGNRSLEI